MKTKASSGRAYEPIVKVLGKRIAKGEFEVGSQLPTEEELCQLFNVSRFTIRAALDQLDKQGLITRKPKIGTVVIAQTPKSEYSLTVGSLSGLLVFLDSTLVTPTKIEEVTTDHQLAEELGCPIKDKWIKVTTIRTPTGSKTPISLTDYYFRPEHKSITKKLGKKTGPIFPLLEKEFDVVIKTIEQNISACILNKEESKTLDTKPNTAALRVIHRLISDSNKALYCTISIYPADRFNYFQTLNRIN